MKCACRQVFSLFDWLKQVQTKWIRPRKPVHYWLFRLIDCWTVELTVSHLRRTPFAFIQLNDLSLIILWDSTLKIREILYFKNVQLCFGFVLLHSSAVTNEKHFCPLWGWWRRQVQMSSRRTWKVGSNIGSYCLIESTPETLSFDDFTDSTILQVSKESTI